MAKEEYDRDIAQMLANAGYSDKAIHFFQTKKNIGVIEDADQMTDVTGPCGDTVNIYLRIDNDKIIDARFITDGCATTIAASSAACELAIGKTFNEAFKITKEVILEQLGGLPEESTHCALLASNTLRAALTDYLSSRNEPWRRLYKKH